MKWARITTPGHTCGRTTSVPSSRLSPTLHVLCGSSVPTPIYRGYKSTNTPCKTQNIKAHIPESGHGYNATRARNFRAHLRVMEHFRLKCSISRGWARMIHIKPFIGPIARILATNVLKKGTALIAGGGCLFVQKEAKKMDLDRIKTPHLFLGEKIEKLTKKHDDLLKRLPDNYCTGRLYMAKMGRKWYVQHSCWCHIHQTSKTVYIATDGTKKANDAKMLAAISNRAQMIQKKLDWLDNQLIRILEKLEI